MKCNLAVLCACARVCAGVREHWASKNPNLLLLCRKNSTNAEREENVFNMLNAKKKSLHLKPQRVKISFKTPVTFCQLSQRVDFNVEIPDDMLSQSVRQEWNKIKKIVTHICASTLAKMSNTSNLVKISSELLNVTYSLTFYFIDFILLILFSFSSHPNTKTMFFCSRIQANIFKFDRLF